MLEVKSEITSLVRGSKFYEDQLRSEVFKMRVRKDAIKQFNIEETAGIQVPDGILADDPLPESPAELIPGLLLAHGCTGIIGGKEVGKAQPLDSKVLTINGWKFMFDLKVGDKLASHDGQD